MLEAAADNALLVPKAPKYLFTREDSCNHDCSQNFDISQEVFHLIKMKRANKIDFDEGKLYSFDGGGTCSAMALDFLARYINECSGLTSRTDITKKATKFRDFYCANTSTYSSRQAAYNTIYVDQQAAIQNPELIKLGKMQSLANFHYLKLTPATGTITIKAIKKDSNKFKKKIKNLPQGTYVVRALLPADNHKQEYFGHSMIFIKGANISLYYDSSFGLVDITGEAEGFVKDKLISWEIPEVRFYRAEHEANAPFNLSSEVAS